MNLYRHYKNKPYKYLGVAKHSESLEDLVVYETGYANDLGKLWVRPRKMFEENIELEGKYVPRFKKIELELHSFIDQDALSHVALPELIKQIFGESEYENLSRDFPCHTGYHLVLALIDGEYVGYKLGYARSSSEFYSWIGGVRVEYRGMGIASDLMQAQHDWCRQNGYRTIQTKSMNQYPEMMKLNLSHGFQIVGIHRSQSLTTNELKIIFEKILV